MGLAAPVSGTQVQWRTLYNNVVAEYGPISGGTAEIGEVKGTERELVPDYGQAPNGRATQTRGEYETAQSGVKGGGEEEEEEGSGERGEGRV